MAEKDREIDALREELVVRDRLVEQAERRAMEEEEERVRMQAQLRRVEADPTRGREERGSGRDAEESTVKMAERIDRLLSRLKNVLQEEEHDTETESTPENHIIAS